MKKAILALVLAGALVMSLAGCGAQPQGMAASQTVTVYGTGEVEAIPDIAILQLGVESKGAT